ncbi:2523_t:CDS:2, partial [Paraglomus occultum]
PPGVVLLKIEEIERKTKILEVSTQISSGYISIKGLKAFKALNIERELSPDYSHEEIVANINMLKYKLEHPGSEIDANLYRSLNDDSGLIKNLGRGQKKVFLEPRENMKCAIPESVTRMCDKFVGGFNISNTSQATRNIFHNKKWKESEHKLVEASERILGALGETWSNPVFMSSISRSEQSEGTYISDIILPLLRSSLGDLLNGNICLSTAERQSLASKARRNAGAVGERMGKKPDIMGLLKWGDKFLELLYVESSRILCSNSKIMDDDVKLWRETLDGVSFVDALCRPVGNQFGIVGIQIAGTTMRLNVLMKDLGGIPRYFHLDNAEIPLSPHASNTKALVRLLLT